MSRRLLYSLFAALLAVGFTVPLSLPASANIGGSMTAGSNTITAGSSTTVTANFNMTNPVGSGNQVQITLTPNGGNTGTANLQWTSETVPGACSPGANTATTSISCIWDPASNGQTASMAMTFSTSSDASGSWTVTSSWTRTSPSGGGTIASTVITVNPAPPTTDLGITKTASAPTVLTGDTLSYTLDYANNGPNTAPSVRIQDALPTGVSFVSVNNPSCSESSGVVTCNLGDLAVGASGQVVIQTTVTASSGASLHNEVEIFSLTMGDPDSSNNFASTDTPVLDPTADLSMTKTASVVEVLPGEPVTFTIDYQNNGPSAATGVTITDVLPAGVTFVSSPGCIHLGGGVINCFIGAVANGGSGSVTIVTSVDNDVSLAGSTLTNSAGISGIESDPVPGNNTDSVDITVSEIADVSVTKSDDVDPVLPGATLTYSISYNNAGPSSATGVVMTDVLPTGVTLVSAGPGCAETSVGSGVVLCDLGILDPLESGSRSIVVTVDAGVTPGAVLTNAVAISMDSSIHDPNTANNQDSEGTTVQAVADLSVAKVDNLDPVQAGGQLEYTLEYDNAGPSDATNVQVVDTLPAGVTFVSATPLQGTCSEASGVVTCDLGDVPAADPIRQITIAVDVSSSLADGATLTNSATITGDQVDQTLANNTATETTAVVSVADMSITKDDALDPVIAGEEIVYTLQYENLGPSDAANVEVVDTLPGGVVFVSATADDGTCSESGGVVTCDLGTIAAGAVSGEITVTVDVPPGTSPGTVTNTATISTDADDTEPDNDTATEATTIETSADLSIIKSATPGTVEAGGNVTYTVTYSNAGPSDATDVVITDMLPAGLAFVSATPDTGTCSEAGGVVTCNVGTVVAGSGGSVLIVVTVSANSGSGSITNSVTVSAATADPTPGDNETTVDVQVLAQGGSTTTTTTPSTTTTTPSTTTTVDVDSLPFTGSDMRVLGAVGLAMLLLGTLALARRRAETE